MKSERFMDALTGIDERYLSETLQRLETPKPVRPRRRLTQSLLLAAVLICCWPRAPGPPTAAT